MKSKILFLSSMICVCSIATAMASECTGDNCYEPEPVYETEQTEYSWFDYGAPATEYKPIVLGTVKTSSASSKLTPMRNVKLLSIKPVPADERAPLWDGTNGEYHPRTYPKTVSWKNGVPLWDDSISNYQKKDFRDWMLSDLPELYLREPDNPNDIELVELYNDTMDEAAATRARIEDLLTPQRPSENLWLDGAPAVVAEQPCDTPVAPTFAPNPKYVAQDLSVPIRAAFGDDGCPFETETECNIWRRKPIIRETVSPRSPKIRADKMYELLSSANCNGELDANSAAAAPLVERYKMLMSSARACCIEGMKYSLKNAGASDGLIYKFMSDDANFYNIGERCLMMSDVELDEKYPESATAAVIADVRNGCLCRGRQWFTAMLAPFVEAWNASPEFAQSPFYWTYRDGLNREVTVSINDDVQNVLNQIAVCP
ncbi:MAG: hypothetical protein J6S80_00285 [Alphaproteobacteria bacterium]|nr:hypothetical protein [Alphaproteobacteria bacterium]